MFDVKVYSTEWEEEIQRVNIWYDSGKIQVNAEIISGTKHIFSHTVLAGRSIQNAESCPRQNHRSKYMWAYRLINPTYVREQLCVSEVGSAFQSSISFIWMQSFFFIIIIIIILMLFLFKF